MTTNRNMSSDAATGKASHKQRTYSSTLSQFPAASALFAPSCPPHLFGTAVHIRRLMIIRRPLTDPADSKCDLLLQRTWAQPGWRELEGTVIDPGIFQKGAKPGAWGGSPPYSGVKGPIKGTEAEAKFYVSVQSLTFSCRKCTI